MPDFIAIIRDESGRGVRADRVDGWDRCPAHPISNTRVHLSGGGLVDLAIPKAEFVKRLDQALTTMLTEAN